jgi:hypothetical protein
MSTAFHRISRPLCLIAPSGKAAWSPTSGGRRTARRMTHSSVVGVVATEVARYVGWAPSACVALGGRAWRSSRIVGRYHRQYDDIRRCDGRLVDLSWAGIGVAVGNAAADVLAREDINA